MAGVILRGDVHPVCENSLMPQSDHVGLLHDFVGYAQVVAVSSRISMTCAEVMIVSARTQSRPALH
jgi:hypothetical protein